MPRLRASIVVAVLAALLAADGLVTGDASGDLQLRHQVLVLTTSGAAVWATEFLKNVLSGYIIPFDEVYVDTPGVADGLEALLWVQKPSRANYSAIIMYPNVEALGYLTRAQIQTLWDFQKQTGVRTLKWGVWPTDMGFKPVPDSDCTTAQQAMALAPDAPLGLSGLKPTAPLDAEDVRRCPGIEASSQQLVCIYFSDPSTPALCSPLAAPPAPFLRLQADPTLGKSYAAPTVAGALLKHADGREVMAFNLECSDHTPTCYALAHMGLSWVLQDIIPGRRRALLSLQVDDVMLNTRLYKSKESYRLTAADLEAHLAWQSDLNARLPKGSNIKLDLVFNGNGVLEKAKSSAEIFDVPPCREQPLYAQLGCNCADKAYSECSASEPEFCRNCTKTWKRPSGAPGVTLVMKGPETWPTADELAAADDLFRLLRSDKATREGFFWVPHSFSHQNLNNVTGDTIKRQLVLERTMSGAGYLDLFQSPTFSHHTIVTAEISGIFNGDVLRAIKQQGIHSVVGDNTWPQLRDRINFNHQLYSTIEHNGFAGMAIMPRFSTVVPYDASTMAEAAQSWYDRYPPKAGAAAAPFTSVIQDDAKRAVLEGLLPLRMDGWMFHQANLRVTPANGNSTATGGRGRSLVMAWVEATLAELGAFVNWLIVSVKLDNLDDSFDRHLAEDACGLSYTLNVSGATGGVTAVTISSTPLPRKQHSYVPTPLTCEVPLTVRPGVGMAMEGLLARRSAVQVDTLGDDARVLVASVPRAGSLTFRLTGSATPWVARKR